MAKAVFGMNVSLDGYVDHDKFAPDPILFRHWIDVVRSGSGSVYGRRMYEIMRYWDDEYPEWTSAHREFADAWRKQPKWVVSSTLGSVGPNATLVGSNPAELLRHLKASLSGSVSVSGTILAYSMAQLGLIDEFQIYLHPVILGEGKPFFAGPLSPLRLVGNEAIGPAATRLTYVPAERAEI